MANLISRPTSRELRERLAESLDRRGLDPRQFRGELRTTEEAHDVQRRLEREGESFDKSFAVAENSPEAKQARAELQIRAGIDPETGRRL